MQPPLIYRSVRDQMQLLQERMQESGGVAQKTHKAHQKIVDEYATQIRDWQEHAAPVQRLRLFTIDELIRLTNLSGRFRAQASHRYAGEALRRCGFKQKRDWTVAGRNKRYWIWSKQ